MVEKKILRLLSIHSNLSYSTGPICCSFTVSGDRESLLQIARADSLQNHSTDVSKRLDGIQEVDERMTVSYLSQNIDFITIKSNTVFPDIQLIHHWYDQQIPTRKQTKP